MSIELIDKIKPKNGGSFSLVDADDVLMPDGSRLSTWEGGGTIPYFDLVELGLPDVPIEGGEKVELETDTAAIMEAITEGAVRLRVNLYYRNATFRLVFTMHDISAPTGAPYFCSHTLDLFGGMPMLLNVQVATGKITAGITLLDLEDSIQTFDLIALGLADIPINGSAVTLETDTTEIIAALTEGAARFRVKMTGGGLQADIVCTMHDISPPAGGQYYCSYAFDPLGGIPLMVNITVTEGSISATCTALGQSEAEVPTFDLTALGLPGVPVTGEQVGVAADTTEIMAALDKGMVRFSLALSEDGEDIPFDAVMTPMRLVAGEDMTAYMCSHAVTFLKGEILNIMFVSGQIAATFTTVGGATAETPATSIDLSALDTEGKVVETFADGTSKTTTLEFDENGNPVKITDGDGNVTTLTW